MESFQHLEAYVQLAQSLELRREMMDRDRLLVLAAVAASERHLEPFAAYCRHRVLEHNPGHMLRRYASVMEASVDPDFQHFLRQVRRRFPSEKVETLLVRSGWQPLAEGPTSTDELERLAALVNVDPNWVRETFSDAPDRD